MVARLLVVTHTEFHRLIGQLEDAAMALGELPLGDPTIPGCYNDLANARKDVYEWVAHHTHTPEQMFRTFLQF